MGELGPNCNCIGDRLFNCCCIGDEELPLEPPGEEVGGEACNKTSPFGKTVAYWKTEEEMTLGLKLLKLSLLFELLLAMAVAIAALLAPPMWLWCN